ncbi:MAG: acyl-CoA thioesterase/bile acid-CoA:amino acid N-acyltransferase family protein [Gemmatimonadaceae bacterium]
MRRAATAFVVTLAAWVPANAQRLVLPRTALADSAFAFRATGLTAGARATLRASMRDSLGRMWSAAVHLTAMPDGSIDTARDMPLAGSDYVAVDAMGVVTALDLAGDARGRERFIAPRLDSLPLLVTLSEGDRIIDTATVLRTFVGTGVTMRAVDSAGIVGTLYLPARRDARPALIVLGGSEGGVGGRDVAALLASHGYVALALGYFGAPGLPAELESIPLDHFASAIELLARQRGVDARRVGVFGTSKGAEAALLLASLDSRVRAVVAYAPSAVSWSCICAKGDAPSWTWGGAPVPYVPPARDPAYAPGAGEPMRPAFNYRYRVRDAAVVERARIPVDRVGAPVLLISGGDDAMWPSQWSGEQVVAHGVVLDGRSSVRHLVYPDAGHLIGKAYMPVGSTRVAGGRIETGGTRQGNAAAQADAWPKVLAFLGTALR